MSRTTVYSGPDEVERRDLCAASVTLNGRPARITGWRQRFARVTDRSSGFGCEWAWETVARIVSNGGKFES